MLHIHSASIRGIRYWPSRPLTSSHRYTGVPSGCLSRTRLSTRPWNFLGRSWKTTQSALTAFSYLDGTVASASRILETATYSEAITKSCTGRQLRLDNNWVT